MRKGKKEFGTGNTHPDLARARPCKDEATCYGFQKQNSKKTKIFIVPRWCTCKIFSFWVWQNAMLRFPKTFFQKVCNDTTNPLPPQHHNHISIIHVLYLCLHMLGILNYFFVQSIAHDKHATKFGWKLCYDLYRMSTSSQQKPESIRHSKNFVKLGMMLEVNSN